MNLNKKILEMEEKLNIPIEENEYTGKNDVYMIFTYEDERPILRANNEVYADRAEITFQLILPRKVDYMKLKHDIRDELEQSGFIITNIRSLLSAALNGTDRIRRVIFETNYTEER